VAERHRGGRLKQWLAMLRRRHPQAQALYAQVRALRHAGEIAEALRASPAEAQLEPA
jgi:tRNA-dihydrouridine synthase C